MNFSSYAMGVLSSWKDNTCYFIVCCLKRQYSAPLTIMACLTPVQNNHCYYKEHQDKLFQMNVGMSSLQAYKAHKQKKHW